MSAKFVDGSDPKGLSSQPYIVTLDDDVLAARLIEETIGLKNMWFTSTESLNQAAASLHPLGAFIDIHLNDECGLDIVPQVRALWPSTVIIVMTGDDSDVLVAQALTAGADDFIRKPMRPVEIMARLKARLDDMHAKNGHTLLSFGDISVDTKHRLVSGPLAQLTLSAREVELIAELIRAKGLVVSKEDLKRSLWRDVKVSDNALDRKIFEVRKAVKHLSRTVELRSIYGVGILLRHKPSSNKRKDMLGKPADLTN